MILIVDDKQENIFALKSILEAHNFPVDTALSGEEALRKILRNNYTLVILDVQMPEMDGFEVAEMILSYSKSKDTPIVFLTAISKEKKFITRGYKAGAIDYITKPVDPDILLLKVSSIYAMSEQRAELRKTQEILMREIEGRKASEKALEEKNRELYSVMESIPQIAFTVNGEKKIEYVNRKWRDFFHEKLDFPAAENALDNVKLNWLSCFKTHEEFSEEVKIYDSREGKLRNFLLKTIPALQDGIFIKWVGTLTDIEKQKLTNELLEHKVEKRTDELIKKNKALEMFNNELQQVAWVLSHDLKEPVRKILTYANLLKDRGLSSDSNAHKYLERILDSSNRMSNLINDLLDLSKMSGNIEFTDVNLEDIVKDVWADLELQVQATGANLICKKLPTIQASVYQIRQLFQNLLSNALKFANENVPPRISISSRFVSEPDFNAESKQEGKYCIITVADNGIGFDEKFVDKIFLVFQRLSNESHEGTGIGLAIVKKIVETHNGFIKAESKPGEGATFHILLPIKQE